MKKKGPPWLTAACAARLAKMAKLTVEECQTVSSDHDEKLAIQTDCLD